MISANPDDDFEDSDEAKARFWYKECGRLLIRIAELEKALRQMEHQQHENRP